MTEVTEEAEQDEKTDVTVGWVASWFMGVVFLLVTLSYLLTFDILPMVFSIVAALITLPPLRARVGDVLSIRLSRWMIILSDGALMVLAGATM